VLGLRVEEGVGVEATLTAMLKEEEGVEAALPVPMMVQLAQGVVAAEAVRRCSPEAEGKMVGVALKMILGTAAPLGVVVPLADTLGETPRESSVAMELAVSVPGALRMRLLVEGEVEGVVGEAVGVPNGLPLGVPVAQWGGAGEGRPLGVPAGASLGLEQGESAAEVLSVTVPAAAGLPESVALPMGGLPVGMPLRVVATMGEREVEGGRPGVAEKVPPSVPEDVAEVPCDGLAEGVGVGRARIWRRQEL
jgi:hypothetical protein